MIARGRASIWALLVALDQFAHALLFGAWYVLTGRGSTPNPDETISSRVGRNALVGKRWALVAAWMIDGLFRLLGERDHCHRAIERDEVRGS